MEDEASASVWIRATIPRFNVVYQGKKKKTFYEIHLAFRGYKWVVELRYKELHALHKKVAKQLPGYMQFTFPPKRFQQMPQRRASASLVEKRRVLLEAWLDGVLSLPETIGNEDMRTHLQVPDEVLAWIDKVNTQREYSALRRNQSHQQHIQLWFVDIDYANPGKPDSGVPIADFFYEPEVVGGAADLTGESADERFGTAGADMSVHDALAAIMYSDRESSSAALDDLDITSSDTDADTAVASFLDGGGGGGGGGGSSGGGGGSGGSGGGRDETGNGIDAAGLPSSSSLILGMLPDDFQSLCFDIPGTLVDNSGWQNLEYQPGVATNPHKKEPEWDTQDPRTTPRNRSGDNNLPGVPAASVSTVSGMYNDLKQATESSSNAYQIFCNAAGLATGAGRGLSVFSIDITATMVAADAVMESTSFLDAVPSKSWSLFERIVLQNGLLERPLRDQEVVMGPSTALRPAKQMELRDNKTKSLLLSGASTLVRGWLYHKTADAGWKRVYCVPEPPLTSHQRPGGAPHLAVYRDAQCTRKAGAIVVEGATVYLCSSLVPFDARAPTPYGFAVVRNDFDAIYFFTTASVADRDLWVASLSRHLYPAEWVEGAKVAHAAAASVAATVAVAVAGSGSGGGGGGAVARSNPFGVATSATPDGARLPTLPPKKAPVPPPRSPQLPRGSPKAPPRRHRPPPPPLVEHRSLNAPNPGAGAASTVQTKLPPPPPPAVGKKPLVAATNPFAAGAAATGAAPNPFAVPVAHAALSQAVAAAPASAPPPVAPRRAKASKATNPFA